MKFYCGIDLSARDCHVCVIDQQLNIVVQNLRNELPKKVQLLEPYKADLKIVAYIYPVETRPVRDLLRRRLHLVQVRAGEYGRLRRLLLGRGILSSKQQEIKRPLKLNSRSGSHIRWCVCTPARNYSGLNSTRNRSRSWKRRFWNWLRPSGLTNCCVRNNAA
jgi:hypothetical protein